MKIRRLVQLFTIAVALTLPSIAQSVPAQESSHSRNREVLGAGLTVQEPQQTKPNTPEAQPPQITPAPERKISPQEAEQLFRSVDEILDFASKTTGLPKKKPVKRELASREQVEKFIEERMKDDEDAKRLERSEVVMKKFGLIPRDFDLKAFMISLLKEQVAGFYDPKRKTVYLLDWLDPDSQKPVLAHELTHALQDQNFGLEKFSKSAQDKKQDGQGDERLAARQAVMEGQAMVVLLDYMLAPANADVTTKPDLVDQMVAAMSSAQSTPVLGTAPLYLKEMLLFPYTTGLNFVRQVLALRGREAAFAGLFASPPRDTREIMQPENYLRGSRMTPLTPPDFLKAANQNGGKWKRFDSGALGAFDIFVLLKQYADVTTAHALTPRFRSSYYLATSPKKGTPQVENMALALVAEFDSADAAELFATVYGDSVADRYPGAKRTPLVRVAAAASNGQTVTPKPPAQWTTDEGPVHITTIDNVAIITEGFDDAAAQRIRDAALKYE